MAGGRLPQTPDARQPPIEAIEGAAMLVVEDEAALAAAVTDALPDAGYIVEHAADGEQALAVLDRPSTS